MRPSGQLILATRAHQVVALAADGSRTIVAGTGESGFHGDGGPAVSARLSSPSGVATDRTGNIYVADTGNNRVRRISPDGIITTFAGDGSNGEPFRSPTLVAPVSPLDAVIYRPRQLATDGLGNVYILHQATFGSYLLRVSAADGLVRLVYPRNLYGASGASKLRAFAVTMDGRVYVSVEQHLTPESTNRLLQIREDGSFEALEMPANSLGWVLAMAADTEGNLYVAESTRVLRVAQGTDVSTIAGFAAGNAIPGGMQSVTELGYTAALLIANETLYVAARGGAGVRTVRVGGCSFPIRPIIAFNGIWNAAGAGYPSRRYAPGEMIAIFGSGLGPATPVSGSYEDGHLAVQAGGSRVLFNRIPGPILYASDTQVNAIVPFGTPGRNVCMAVEYNGVPSDEKCYALDSIDPGIFQAGTPATMIVQHQDGRINSQSNPAEGGSVVTVWGTGFGPFIPALQDGEVVQAPGALASPVSVTIGDAPAAVLYAGPAPGLVAGVVQLNFALPQGGTAPITSSPVHIRIGDTTLTGTVWWRGVGIAP